MYFSQPRGLKKIFECVLADKYNKTKQNIQVLIVNLKFKEIFTTHYKDILHYSYSNTKYLNLHTDCYFIVAVTLHAT